MTKTKRLRALTLSSAFVLLTATTTNAAPSPEFDAAGWQSDYRQLKQILEREYANLAWAASPQSGIDLPRLDQRTQNALATAQTDAEARRALEDFIAAFHGGHLQIMANLAPATTPAAPDVQRRPFDAADPVATCASLGFDPGSNPVSFSLPFEVLPNFHLESDGLQTVYRSGIYTASDGRKIGIIRIPHFSMRALPAVCTLAWAQLAADKKPLTNGSVRDAAYALWFTSFHDTIDHLHKVGATALVIDVGNNSGGGDEGDFFPRLLTDAPVQSPALLMVASEAGRAYFNEEISGLEDELKEHPGAQAEAALSKARDFFVDAKAKASTPCDMSWVWHEQRSWTDDGCKRLVPAGYAGGYSATQPKGAFGNQDVSGWLSSPSAFDQYWGMWNGPVYVITNGGTYSSAEMFAADIQDNHIGKTVGTQTGGDGCGFMGNENPPMLTHSHIRLRIPNCVRLRRDGSNEVSGIKPQLPILPTEGEGDAERGLRLLNTIAADVK